jgi:F1F0 ATPase subunit 2
MERGMTDLIEAAGRVVMAAGLGVLLGLAFFGSLRWVVGRVIAARRPAVWMVGSAIVRVAVVVAALVVIGQGRWERMVAVLAGFLVGRSVALRIWGRERS